MICYITYINSKEILSCSHHECSISCNNGGYRTGECTKFKNEKRCECEDKPWKLEAIGTFFSAVNGIHKITKLGKYINSILKK